MGEKHKESFGFDFSNELYHSATHLQKSWREHIMVSTTKYFHKVEMQIVSA